MRSTLPLQQTPSPPASHHDSLVQHDLDLDDSDGGAPLYAVTTTSTMTSASTTEPPLLDQDSPWSPDDDEEAVLEAFGLGPHAVAMIMPDLYSESESEPDTDASLPIVPELEMGHADQFLVPAPPPGQLHVPPPPPPEPWQHLAQQPLFAPMLDTILDNLPPVQLSNPNPFVLGSENLGLVDFLRDWARLRAHESAARTQAPDITSVLRQAAATPSEVTLADLEGDDCDFQALNWTAMGTTRQAARARRRVTYRNHVNCHGSDTRYMSRDQEEIGSSDSFMRFKKMTIRQDVSLTHFQLRSVLACPSATKAYYPSTNGIICINSAKRKTDVVLNLRHFPSTASAITTLDADHGVLLAGTFNGEYVLQSLYTANKRAFSDGHIGGVSGITNHIKIHLSRQNSRPVAAIASNDNTFRVMDLETERFLSKTSYPFAPNCSALSPDHRLRIVVGDHCDVLVTDAGSGEILRQLAGHRDYGFACDWSEDGWTIATGFQDRGIKIWDARRWCNTDGVSTPLHTIRSEMAGARSLRFSPLGSGKNVLVAAEEADYVNIIDAQSFRTKQTIDVFGEIGGIAFANSGQDLNVLCCDNDRGGLLQLERCGRGPEPIMENDWSRQPSPSAWLEDWRTMQGETRLSFPTRCPATIDGLQPF